MSPALALAYWWDSLNYSHNFDDFNLFVATRPDKDIQNVMTIYDAVPARFRCVETASVRHPTCRFDVRSSDYLSGWNTCELIQTHTQALTSYVQEVSEGYRFEIGHGTIQTGPTFRGSIPEENLELFSMTVSFQYGYTAI